VVNSIPSGGSILSLHSFASSGISEPPNSESCERNILSAKPASTSSLMHSARFSNGGLIEHHVAWRAGPSHRCSRRRGNRYGRKRLSAAFGTSFVLLYMVFHSAAECAVLILPIYALTGGLILQELLGYNFSVAVWVGYIALFGIAVETGVVMVVYLHEALDRRLASGKPLKHEDIEEAAIEGAVHRLRPKLMTVCVVLASLIPSWGKPESAPT